MTDHTTQQPSVKLCECGCGQPIVPPKYPSRQRRYILGHNARGIHSERKKVPIVERFWRNLTPGSPDECWEWQGQMSRKYGVLSISRVPRLAHRLSYELHNGPIPDGMSVCHSCDNPVCCNPSHLWIGTHADNNADMRAKGRDAPLVARNGEDNGFSKLREVDVLEIRRLATNGIAQIELARRYNVCPTTIGFVVRRETWQHI